MSELGFDFGAKLLEVSDLDSHGVELCVHAVDLDKHIVKLSPEA